ncbi:MAG: hypothetical protein ABII06_15225 [Pseudomonadota bacterium]
MMMINDIKDNADTCSHHCKGLEVPTDDEVAVLNEMRALKDQVKSIKRKISGISPSGDGSKKEDLAGLESDLARLKIEWKDLDAKRQEAARQRMIILGHEKP